MIQEKQFERIGGIKTLQVDVRIIAATNQDLEKAITEKKFREDLFYRINVIPIHLPPLRERRVDIPILANHFLRKFNKLKRKNVEKIVPEVMEYLMRYSWPGNVRELENLIEMIVVLKEEGDIEFADLPDKIVMATPTGNLINGIEITELGINYNDLVDQPAGRSQRLEKPQSKKQSCNLLN